MGLIKAVLGAINGTLADQWKEYFYCDSLSADILAAKGVKRTSRRSSNTRGDNNIISNGSVIAVNEGQCMMIVEQGKVVEFSAEPGEFRWDSSTEPSIFEGSLGRGIRETFATIGKRFTFGGDTGKDQRIYYFNTKEIIGNKYGTASPVPFRVVDRNIGLDVDISIRCNGEYSYKITNPILFYTNVCANISGVYSRTQIDSMLKSELLTALQPAFAKISEMGIRYSALPGHTMELADALNEVLDEKWKETRGMEVASFGINSVTASPEDEKMIKDLQQTAVFRNQNMAAAKLVGAQAEAMTNAAGNPNGAMMGFMGLSMAQQQGGFNPQALYRDEPEKSADSWTCSCGTANTGKFCQNCGKSKPTDPGSWTCSCGAVNTGKFCQNCGKQKAASGAWTCSCGTSNTGKFCQGCGAKKPD